MATKKITNLVDSDMKKRDLPRYTRAPKKKNLVAHTFMIPESDLEDLRAFADGEGCSINAAARLAIKRLLRSGR